MALRTLKGDPRKALFEMRFPACRDPETGLPLPEVLTPAGRYPNLRREAGKNSFVVLDDAAQRRLAIDESFRSMLANGTYVWRDDLHGTIPEFSMSTTQRQTRLEQEVAVLRNRLRKAGIDPSTPEAAQPTEQPAEPPASEGQPEQVVEAIGPSETVMFDRTTGKTRARKVPRGGMKIGGDDVLAGLQK
jgi:hypothetical protein